MLLRCAVWNIGSLNNKLPGIMEHILDRKSDIVFLTETWLPSDKNSITAEVKTYGYKLLHNRRKDRLKEIGGGVGILIKDGLISKKLPVRQFISFEHSMVKLSLSRGGYLFLISIYRLQYESITTFMTEFTELLNLHVICNKYNFVIAGDINIHVETEKTYANQFKNILSLYDLKQHVTEATHIKGHTIDVVITPNIDSYVQDLNITQLDLSHHSLIDFNLKTETKTKSEKTISFRSFKNIDTPQFRSEVQEKLIDLPQTNNIQSRVKSYNATLTELVEKHAPVKTKVIKVVNEAPWFDVEYSNLRKLRRNAEKKYHKTHLEEDRMSYINLRKQTINLSFEKKKMYISNKLKNSNSSKALYTIVNELIDKKKQIVLPTNKSDEVLANKFQIFFIEKIEKIRSSFKPTTEKVVEYKHNENINLLSNFEPTTADEIKEIITSFGVKCSPEDPVPAELLSSNVDIFIPFWLEIVNLSLEMGSMDGLKSAVVLPLKRYQ